ncbi:MAG TPA: cytochrome c [Candidatus Baltobacteraceae bacterium]|nr:cytochrome c [Candidatus Baltobacteraceae bacterium]
MIRSLIPLAIVCTMAACAHAGSTSSVAASPKVAAPSLPPDNGKLIFQTGKDAAGRQIAAAKPPLRHSCAACHGVNGAGGVHLPHGAVSADLRHDALTVAQKPHPYTLALLERAISTGVDNNAQPLNPVMPRWKLSNRDLHDVAAYVRTQLK